MLYLWIDILGTASFAISGALTAIRKRLDIFGVIIIAFVTAIGGGTIRDLLIGSHPVGWLQDLLPGTIIFASTIVAVIFRKHLGKFSTSLFLFDTIGIGLFTIIGIEKALSTGIHPILCIGLGTVSACFGGVTRDILCNEIPIIFQKEIYATACMAGGIVYISMKQIETIDNDYITIASIGLVICIRLYAVIFKKSLPSIYSKDELSNY